MPVIARKDGVDTAVSEDHGQGEGCLSKVGLKTLDGFSDVFVNNVGVVRKGDKVGGPKWAVDSEDGGPDDHYLPGCMNVHQPALTSSSPNVFANNKNIGRKGDEYTAGHPITTGCSNVFANGD